MINSQIAIVLSSSYGYSNFGRYPLKYDGKWMKVKQRLTIRVFILA
ncbi:MAG: hypothetical protein U5L09_05735 [Bacteroidales bacterium]|nr:hypothetical protein [Bacteroidales bacterium]